MPLLTLPATAENWRTSLGNAPLPILASSSQATKQLAGRPSLSATQLAKIVHTDASLSLQVLARANTAVEKSVSTSGEAGVFSVAHGVSLLGVEGALQSILELPTTDTITHSPQREGLIATLAKAYLAGELATGLSSTSQEKCRAAAQAQFLGELIGWRGADRPAERFSAVWHRDPNEREEKEREQFGISLTEIGEITAEDMGLAHALRAAGQNQQPVIAARLANAVSLGWHTEETKALIEQMAEFLGTPGDEVEADVHRVTAAAARSFAEPTAMHAARILLLEEDEVAPSWYVAAQPKDSSRSTAVDQCSKIAAAYAAGKSTIHQTFQTLTHTMKSSMDFDRVIVALLSKKRDKLVARFSSEVEDVLLSQFVVELEPVNLFTKLLGKPAGFLVTPENLERFENRCRQPFNRCCRHRDSVSCPYLSLTGRSASYLPSYRMGKRLMFTNRSSKSAAR